MPAVQAIAAQAQADALLGFGEGEPDLFIRAAPLQVPVTAAPDANWGSGQWCLSAKGAKDLLGMLLTLPSGVLQPSLTIPGALSRCCSVRLGVLLAGPRRASAAAAWARRTCMPSYASFLGACWAPTLAVSPPPSATSCLPPSHACRPPRNFVKPWASDSRLEQRRPGHR